MDKAYEKGFTFYMTVHIKQKHCEKHQWKTLICEKGETNKWDLQLPQHVNAGNLPGRNAGRMQRETGKLLTVRNISTEILGQQATRVPRKSERKESNREKSSFEAGPSWIPSWVVINKSMWGNYPSKGEKLPKKIEITFLGAYSGEGIISVLTNQIRKPQNSWVNKLALPQEWRIISHRLITV